MHIWSHKYSKQVQKVFRIKINVFERQTTLQLPKKELLLPMCCERDKIVHIEGYVKSEGGQKTIILCQVSRFYLLPNKANILQYEMPPNFGWLSLLQLEHDQNKKIKLQPLWRLCEDYKVFLRCSYLSFKWACMLRGRKLTQEMSSFKPNEK